MRLNVSCLLFTLVAALLIPISAEAQTDTECVAVYDANGTRVARAHEPKNSTVMILADQGRRFDYESTSTV
jgi:hypothetical protein